MMMWGDLFVKVTINIIRHTVIHKFVIQMRINNTASYSMCLFLLIIVLGNRCIQTSSLSLEGTAINDSHAEVLARRAFLR